MPPLAVALWIANVILDTAGHLAFKAAASGDWKARLRSARLWGGIACFCLEFVAWLALLSLIPLSQAVLIGSINIVAVMVAGRIVFHERLDGMRLAAMALIALGVALSGRFS
jgi:drug/metabolite transporter (DMT)-like permease